MFDAGIAAALAGDTTIEEVTRQHPGRPMTMFRYTAIGAGGERIGRRDGSGDRRPRSSFAPAAAGLACRCVPSPPTTRPRGGLVCCRLDLSGRRGPAQAGCGGPDSRTGDDAIGWARTSIVHLRYMQETAPAQGSSHGDRAARCGARRQSAVDRHGALSRQFSGDACRAWCGPVRQAVTSGRP